MMVIGKKGRAVLFLFAHCVLHNCSLRDQEKVLRSTRSPFPFSLRFLLFLLVVVVFLPVKVIKFLTRFTLGCFSEKIFLAFLLLSAMVRTQSCCSADEGGKRTWSVWVKERKAAGKWDEKTRAKTKKPFVSLSHWMGLAGSKRMNEEEQQEQTRRGQASMEEEGRIMGSFYFQDKQWAERRM